MDKVALTTGVGPGTGSAIARRFHEGGYRVAAGVAPHMIERGGAIRVTGNTSARRVAHQDRSAWSFDV